MDEKFINKDSEIKINNNNNNNESSDERNMTKMKKIYESIMEDKRLEKHINKNRDDKINFIQNYPYDNLPHNETFVFNNICMFNDLSCVNGYVNINDNLKVIDFNGNYKLNEKINLSQRCLLPENLFYQKYNYQNPINPLDKKLLDDYLLK